MSYMLMPMHVHPDKGFGICADSFFESTQNFDKKKSMYHMPYLYLLRHSIELYLKSLIILFQVKFDTSVDTEKVIHDFSNEHKIDILFEQFIILFERNQSWLLSNTRTNWILPDSLFEDIKRIADIDNNSTYYRYPITKDRIKDSKKDESRVSSERKVLDDLANSKRYKRVLIVESSKSQDIYEFGNEYDKEKVEIFERTGTLFHGMHFACRVELFGGL